MSNYYKNNVNIAEYASNWITNSNAYNSFKRASGNFAVTLNTNYSGFTEQINEKPDNETGYKYNGVDIATYMVASFAESSTANFTSSQIPAWCNKLRVILIGGGAGGGTAQTSSYWAGANYNQQTAKDQSHQCYKYYNIDGTWGQGRYQNDRYDNDTPVNNNQQAPSQNTTAGGGGGGGGAFIYLPTFDVSSTKSTVQIQLGSAGDGGAALSYVDKHSDSTQRNKGQAGGATVLKISNADYSVAGGGGISNEAWEAGAAGTASGQNTGTNVAGQAGQAYSGHNGGAAGASGCTTTYSTNTTIRSYGVGGSGSTAIQGTGYPAGGNGAKGYYRVYFLTS